MLALIFSFTLFASCDDIQQSPKVIDADGQTYVACHGLVWVNLEGSGFFGGGGTFKVTFTDAQGLNHTLRGLRKVSLAEVPKPQSRERATRAPEPMTPEEQRILDIYRAAETAEARRTITAAWTPEERQLFASAFVKDFENRQTAPEIVPDLCAAH